jgi:hypothetical protein
MKPFDVFQPVTKVGQPLRLLLGNGDGGRAAGLAAGIAALLVC